MCSLVRCDLQDARHFAQRIEAVRQRRGAGERPRDTVALLLEVLEDFVSAEPPLVADLEAAQLPGRHQAVDLTRRAFEIRRDIANGVDLRRGNFNHVEIIASAVYTINPPSARAMISSRSRCSPA